MKEMQQPKQYIRKQGGMQMNLPLKLQTLDNGRLFSVKALLDSGSMGSCMGKCFVEKDQIPTK
jgi:hypothetical protein